MITAEAVVANSPSDRLLTRRQLIERRGWTADLFQFLPAPDQVRENPRNLRGAPIKLYRESTIIEVEERESFKLALETATRRKEAAGKAKETKRRKFLECIAQVPAPELPAFTRAELSRRTLEAAAVDYLLDQAEGYRCALMEKYRAVEFDDRQHAIDQKILDAIVAAQPWLGNECERRTKMIQRAENIIRNS